MRWRTGRSYGVKSYPVCLPANSPTGRLTLTLSTSRTLRLTARQRAYTDALTDPYSLHPATFPRAVLIYRYVGGRVMRDLVTDNGVVIEQQAFRASPADRAFAQGAWTTPDGRRVEWRERRGAGPQLPWAGGERRVRDLRQPSQRPLGRPPAGERAA